MEAWTDDEVRGPGANPDPHRVCYSCQQLCKDKIIRARLRRAVQHLADTGVQRGDRSMSDIGRPEHATVGELILAAKKGSAQRAELSAGLKATSERLARLLEKDKDSFCHVLSCAMTGSC